MAIMTRLDTFEGSPGSSPRCVKLPRSPLLNDILIDWLLG